MIRKTTTAPTKPTTTDASKLAPRVDVPRVDAPKVNAHRVDPTFVPRAAPAAVSKPGGWATLPAVKIEPIPRGPVSPPSSDSAASVSPPPEAAAPAAPRGWGPAPGGTLKPLPPRADRPARVKLPIDAHEDEIVRMVCAHPVTVIEASTGSGKTTRVPVALLDRVSGKPGKRVVVLQPRRLAARKVSERVAHELGVALGDEVGYAIGQERKYGDKTQLLFVTTGWLRAKLTSDPDFLESIKVLVFDEVHERSTDADMLSVAVQTLMKRMVDRPRLVLMSATMCSTMVQYFTPEGAAELPPTVTVGVPTHPIEERYLTGTVGHQIFDAYKKYQGFYKDYEDDVVREAKAILDSRRGKDNKTLVFLDGLHMIQKMSRALGKDYRVFVLHSSVDHADQEAAFAPREDGEPPHVVLATNIAETSVTVPDCSCVINFGTHKEVVDRTLGSRWVSRDTNRQRRGRTGRTCPGVVYHMFPREMVDLLPASPTPEVLRVNLETVVLSVFESMSKFFKNVYELMAALPDPVDEYRVGRALVALIDTGALKWSTGQAQIRMGLPDASAIEVTPLGRFLRHLPFGIDAGRMLAVALEFSAPDALVYALLMASLPTNLPLYALPHPVVRTDVELNRYVASSRRLAYVRATADGGHLSDSLAEARILLKFMANAGNLAWCEKNGVHQHRARTSANTVAEMALRLSGLLPGAYSDALDRVLKLARNRTEIVKLPEEGPHVPALCALMVREAYCGNRLTSAACLPLPAKCKHNSFELAGKDVDSQTFKRSPLDAFAQDVESASMSGAALSVTLRSPSVATAVAGHDLVRLPPALDAMMSMCAPRAALAETHRISTQFGIMEWSGANGKVFIDRSSSLCNLTPRADESEPFKSIEAVATEIRHVRTRDGQKVIVIASGLTVIPNRVTVALRAIDHLRAERLSGDYINTFDPKQRLLAAFLAAM